MPLSEPPEVHRLTLATVTSVPEWHPEHDTFEPFPVHAWVIRHPDGPILVDTGVGLNNRAIDEWYHPQITLLASSLHHRPHTDRYCGRRPLASPLRPLWPAGHSLRSHLRTGGRVRGGANTRLHRAGLGGNPEGSASTRQWRCEDCRRGRSIFHSWSYAWPSIGSHRSRRRAAGPGCPVCLSSGRTAHRPTSVLEPSR